MAEVVPLGNRLRARREELGLSQAQAARQLDVARTAYRLWEMEAARPAPDRWRVIARWLGISMTALLHAEELLDEQESHDAHQAALAAGMTEAEWDALTGTRSGERSDHVPLPRASTPAGVPARIQPATTSARATDWHPGHFRKRLPNDSLAPALARTALAATALGIPSDHFHDAALLVSELVTNSVMHTDSEWVEVAITLGADSLRIEVSDANRQALRPHTPTADRGWGLTLVAELATRWGVERHQRGKVVWVELDLTGSGPVR